MKIPNSCVICLRPMWRTADKLTMHVEFPGGECRSYYLYTALAEQIKSIAEYLAPKDQKERVAAMGGTVIKPQAQIILERGIEQGIQQGIEQGLERGIEQGKRETVFGLAEMGMPLEQIAQAVKIGVDTVRQWLEGGADQADMRTLRG